MKPNRFWDAYLGIRRLRFARRGRYTAGKRDGGTDATENLR